MAPLTNLHGITKTLGPITCLPNAYKTHKRGHIVGFMGSSKTHEISECSIQTTRRATIGLASIVLTGQFNENISLAGDNGFWYDEPLPQPTATNKIANEKTGTRSFIKKGMYMANIGVKGSAYRIKKYAFDLLAMADLVAEDTLNYVRRYLRLKSTFMYFDFDKVISAIPLDDKQQLTDMANKLFDNLEKLEEAATKKNFPEARSCYHDTEVMLREVMNRMDLLYKTI